MRYLIVSDNTFGGSSIYSIGISLDFTATEVENFGTLAFDKC